MSKNCSPIESGMTCTSEPGQVSAAREGSATSTVPPCRLCMLCTMPAHVLGGLDKGLPTKTV